MQRQKFFLKRYFSSFLAYHFAIKRLLLPAFLLISALLAEPFKKGKLKAVSTHTNIRLQVSSYKRYSTIKKQSPFMRDLPLHDWKSVHFIMMFWDFKIKKRVAYKGRGYIRHLVYCPIRRGNCFSITKSLFQLPTHIHIKRHSHKCTLNLSPYVPKASKRRNFSSIKFYMGRRVLLRKNIFCWKTWAESSS